MTSRRPVKVAFVIQRYGNEVVGGAESLAKQLAERFAKYLGWDIEVLTTTAVDYMSWANEYPESTTTINGVKVRRFNSFCERSKLFGLIHRFALRYWPSFNRRPFLKAMTLCLEWIWLLAQGPVCPKLISYLKKNVNEYDQIFYFTYLYYPTLWGYKETLPKGVVITTAHDELPFHFHLVRRMLNNVPHIITLNPEETALVRTKLSSHLSKVQLAGLGIDIPEAKIKTVTNNHNEIEKNALYLGRISAGKGVATLIEWMQQGFTNIKLRLAGKVESDLTLPSNSQIDYRGFVSEEDKASLIDDASVLINPSAHESLSLIVLEAMARKRPVLVNGNCAVLDHYAKETKTVFSYKDQQSFADTLGQILSTDWDSEEKKSDLMASAEWVKKHYSWPAVFAAYESTIRN